MKASRRTRSRWIPLAMSAILIGKLTVFSQQWQTVDDFGFAGGDAEAHGVALDAAGGIYVVGTANGHGIVRYSADGGGSWSTLDDFIYPSETNNVLNAVTVDNQGTVFVGGNGGGHWIIRRSTDLGLTWETVDDYWRAAIPPEQPGTNGVVYSLSTDAQGQVFGAGPLFMTHCPCYNHWWVRGSSSGGTNWDTKLVLFSILAEVSQISWAGEDAYVTGAVAGQAESTGLIVKSSDFGATWSTNFEGTEEIYSAISSDIAGNIYAAGNILNSSSYDWVVRKSAPGGTNWTVIDKSTYPDKVTSPHPHSIAVDGEGNICVAGEFQERWVVNGTNGTTSGANQFWFTRQYSVAADQWTTTDFFSYTTNSTSSTNTHAIAMGTTITPDGSTFVVGYGTSDSGQHRWVVRKRTADTRPRLQIAAGNGSVTVSWPIAATNSVLEWSDSAGVNKVWQMFLGNVTVANGQKTATLGLTSGARLFRLKNATGN
jgi:hypothetical protein